MMVEGSILDHQRGYWRVAFPLQYQVMPDAQPDLCNEIDFAGIEQPCLGDWVAYRREALRMGFGQPDLVVIDRSDPATNQFRLEPLFAEEPSEFLRFLGEAYAEGDSDSPQPFGLGIRGQLLDAVASLAVLRERRRICRDHLGMRGLLPVRRCVPREVWLSPAWAGDRHAVEISPQATRSGAPRAGARLFHVSSPGMAVRRGLGSTVIPCDCQ